MSKFFGYHLILDCNNCSLTSIKNKENIKNICSNVHKKSMTGRKHSEETKEKMRKAKLGTKQSEEHKQKRTNKLKGLKRNFETRSKMSSSVPTIKPFLYKPILQYDLSGNFIKEWESATIAAQFLNKQNGNIVECLKGKKKKAYGYIWKYKEN